MSLSSFFMSSDDDASAHRDMMLLSRTRDEHGRPYIFARITNELVCHVLWLGVEGSETLEVALVRQTLRRLKYILRGNIEKSR